MAVNLSAEQLDRDEIVDHVYEALSSSGLDPDLLVLELTERTLMRDIDTTVGRLVRLKRFGLRIAVDDFGTGYSSLAYLRQLPIDVLKIDKSFVDGVAETRASAALVHTQVQLARTMGFETIAEGIETEEQLAQLRYQRVDRGQGFLFARPLDAEAALAYARDHLPVIPVAAL
jgi:EAL domain-containing protein (putative c-di-GMP-specific phosphodiesterase class I)